MSIETNKIKTEFSLSDISPGKTVKLVKIDGGRCFSGRMASLGIFGGTLLKVISNGFIGPMIVAVEGSRFAIGRCEAHRIIVIPVS